MERSFLPLVLWALALAAIIGVLFQQVYPGTEMNAELGALFALAGLLLAVLLRASWRALLGRHR